VKNGQKKKREQNKWRRNERNKLGGSKKETKKNEEIKIE
jgi:hypothetical protein